MTLIKQHPLRFECQLRYPQAQDVVVWEWLVDNISTRAMRVEGTEVVDNGYGHVMTIRLASEVDALRLSRWAQAVDFQASCAPLVD